MSIDKKGLALLMAQASELANRAKLTSQEEKRYSVLLSQISLLKTGEVTLADLDQENLNTVERRNGFEQTRLNPTRMTHEQRAKAEAWQTMVKVVGERRTANETEGNILARIGSYSGGQFVPTEFLSDVFAAAASHDALFDEDAITYYESSTGRVTQVPTFGDIENEAVQVDEAGDTSSGETNLAVPGHANVGVYSFRSPLWRVPIEAVQDVEAMGGAMEIFKKFAADRIARGVGKKLVSGNGVDTILGLVPSLLALGVTPVTAVGSAGNTGGSENGIGSQDIASLYYNVNEAYRNSPKAAWFMNDGTRAYLAQIVSKMGVPLVHWQGPEAYIFGKPVKVCPGMDSIGASKSPVVFGDGSYWMTRCVFDDLTYVQMVREAVGLIEKGLVGFRMYARYGGSLLYTDANSPAPFGVLKNHS